MVMIQFTNADYPTGKNFDRTSLIRHHQKDTLALCCILLVSQPEPLVFLLSQFDLTPDLPSCVTHISQFLHACLLGLPAESAISSPLVTEHARLVPARCRRKRRSAFPCGWTDALLARSSFPFDRLTLAHGLLRTQLCHSCPHYRVRPVRVVAPRPATVWQGLSHCCKSSGQGGTRMG
jgi:hypothetical protein